MNHVEHSEPLPSLDGPVTAAIIELANEAGASEIAADARSMMLGPEARVAQHQRHLCIRLGHHLVEQHRALQTSPGGLSVRIAALSKARVRINALLDTRADNPDPRRSILAASLAVERRKFLMATKADALLALEQELAIPNQSRQHLRTAAAVMSHLIAVDLLTGFWRQLSAVLARPIAEISRALLADLERATRDLGETFSPQALIGFDLQPLRELRGETEWPVATAALNRVPDRWGLATRRRIHRASREYLTMVLTQGTQRVMERMLVDYDYARTAVEQRFCELLDSALSTLRVAAELAGQAHREGPDGVARARRRIAHLSAALGGVIARVEAR